MIESKALQPVVQLRMRQTVFQAAPGQLPSFGLDPAAGGGRGEAGRMGAGAAAALAVRVQMDTDVRALLEYSTDGQVGVQCGGGGGGREQVGLRCVSVLGREGAQLLPGCDACVWGEREGCRSRL